MFHEPPDGKTYQGIWMMSSDIVHKELCLLYFWPIVKHIIFLFWMLILLSTAIHARTILEVHKIIIK